MRVSSTVLLMNVDFLLYSLENLFGGLCNWNDNGFFRGAWPIEPMNILNPKF